MTAGVTARVLAVGTAAMAALALPPLGDQRAAATFDRKVVLSANRKNVVADKLAYNQAAGILPVEAAPDGRLYFGDPSGIHRLVQ